MAESNTYVSFPLRLTPAHARATVAFVWQPCTHRVGSDRAGHGRGSGIVEPQQRRAADGPHLAAAAALAVCSTRAAELVRVLKNRASAVRVRHAACPPRAEYAARPQQGQAPEWRRTEGEGYAAAVPYTARPEIKFFVFRAKKLFVQKAFSFKRVFPFKKLFCESGPI